MNPVDTALAILRSVLDAVLQHVPTELVQKELDEAAVRRANLAADAAEEVKFGE